MQIKDIMSRDIDSITPDTPIHQIARRMRAADVGVLPVVENGTLLGIVTDRDIVIRGIAENGIGVTEVTADKVMTKDVLTCKEDQSLDDLKKEMQSRAVRRVAVTDTEEKLVGMVSIGDLAKQEAHKAGTALRDIAKSS
jgi:CBS domain-containing protein